ncbi:MAG: N-methyl-L-tryptophan oxidase [Pirellulaceae bacterium]
MNSYDAIVIGLGGVGGAAAMHLARRGAHVLGIERFSLGHDRGSSHGQTRIIRQAYFEHPDYVPLLRRAYALWEELESHCGEQLYWEAGLLEVGPADGVVVPGVRESARRYTLPVDEFSPAEAMRQFPAFVIPDDCVAMFERRAGLLHVERCVLAHADEARKLGADLHAGESVLRWSADKGGVVVETDVATYGAAKLVVAGGAWSSQLLSDLRVPLRVVRKHLHWHANDDPRYRLDGGCPTFFYETRQGYFYGFPQLDERGVKLAEHSGGEEAADPLGVNRDEDPRDVERVGDFLRAHLPGVSAQRTGHAVCMYTLTADEHFLVDRHPEHPQVVFAAGLSGHGFKFTGVLGEILADLALAGETTQPVEFLRLDRPGIRSR